MRDLHAHSLLPDESVPTLADLERAVNLCRDNEFPLTVPHGVRFHVMGPVPVSTHCNNLICWFKHYYATPTDTQPLDLTGAEHDEPEIIDPIPFGMAEEIIINEYLESIEDDAEMQDGRDDGHVEVDFDAEDTEEENEMFDF